MDSNNSVGTADGPPLIDVALMSDGTSCHVIPSGNASLAADWENIPETLMLNFVIGITLFLAFVWLTWIAWRRADSEDKLRTQNIVTFLYGYRDPEDWYVIPRFEFLRHEDRHHKHDKNYPHIYIPPKLPMANPLEMIAYGSDIVQQTKSLDSTHEHRSGKKINSLAVQNLDKTHSVRSHSMKNPEYKTASKSLDTTLSDSPITSVHTAPVVSPTGHPNSPADGQSTPPDDPRREATNSIAIGNSFFFPSILTAEQLQASWLSKKLNRFFARFFRVTDADIIYSRGLDAYEYLLFQRHLIFILFVTSILCCGVILPIHWVAGNSDSSKKIIATSFQQSTIKNIASKAHLHWAHIICSGIIVLISLKVMASYKESIITQDDPQISRRTLLIGNIPSEQRSRTGLTQVFREYFPQNSIEAIQFVYDTSALDDYEMYLSSTIVAKNYCAAYKHKRKTDIYVHRTDVNSSRVCNGYCRICSFVYVCCCYWPCESKELGTTYYAREEQHYRQKITEACHKLVKEPAEYAFVTFRTHKQARKVMSELATLKQEVIQGKTLSRALRSEGVESPATPTTELEEEEGARQVAGATPTKTGSKSVKSAKVTTDEPNNSKTTQSPVNSAPTTTTTTTTTAHAKTTTPASLAKAPTGSSPADGIVNLTESSDTTTTTTTSTKVTKARQPHSKPSPSPVSVPAAIPTGKGSPKRLEGPLMWSVRYAPHPDNVEYNDLLNLTRTSKFTIIFLHILMIIIFIFITTPNVILSMIERLSVLRPDKAAQLTGFESLFINYFSILLQIITTTILPALITIISKQIPYEDSSTKGHSVMWKVYSFLILMVIVMPSIGMSSAQALFDSDIDPKCLFPPDNGAYYINYVISSIFLSTVLELIKPMDIFYYYSILWTSRSTAEVEGGRQFIEREFSVGMQHTGVLLIFSVVMTYSISCPLIAPVGLIYMCVKHCVDHYNLYYTYFTKKVDKDLQSTIVVFVKVALLLMLFQTTIAIYTNTGTSYFSLLTQMIFWITLAALVFNCFFDCTSRSLPPTKRAKYHNEFCACFYLPKVITSLLRLDAIPASCISRKV